MVFRRLFRRDNPSNAQEPGIERGHQLPQLEISVSYSGNHAETDRRPQPPYASMEESEWEAYERYWEWGKDDYDNRETWRKVRRVVYQHVHLEAKLSKAYSRREVDGVVPAIERCNQLIAIAPLALEALPLDHEINQDFLRWEERQWGIPLRESTPFRMPEHRGFKQLAIIREKEKDFTAAIDVCEHAMRVGWPGDWDVRIARCRRRSNTSKKPS